ncbi:MAG: putative bifunctional diguanylate cyclase/phosphodiesterase [Sphingomonas sp.]|uniref:putative bifunctional diguanylate cyclase/phosphodiesterase n=1 Tax=Sphingomonas sp. TaxID=28214 RepID=UPI003F823640
MVSSDHSTGDSLFLLSFRQRGELSAIAAAAGWRVVAARRSDGAARRYLGSGAALAVLDARGALGEGLAVAGAFGDAARVRGGALLVLVSRDDVGALGDFYAAGATHFLVSPFTEAEFAQTLRFAWRFVERVAGDWDRGRAIELLGWRYNRRSRRLRLTPALAKRLDMAQEVSLDTALRTLGSDDRTAAAAAVRRVSAGGATAFAHDHPGVGRLVHHVQAVADDPWIHGLIEELGSVPDAAAETDDALEGAFDAGAARAWLDRRLRRGDRASAILVALSRFDLVNSGYGRPAGDALIRAAVRRIAVAARTTLGKHQVVARMKGPEFLVGVEEAADAEALAEALVEALARPFAIDGTLVAVGARLGVAAARTGEDVDALVRRANDALDDARASDGATIRVADEPVIAEALSVDLRRAIESGEIAVVFQPQVAIATGKIVGVEALARWEHPRFGAVGADQLFAAADRADLGLALSDHIQRLALKTATGWPATLSALRLSINLTAADIARPGFADILLDRIDAAGFARSRLTVEITESGLIDDLSAASVLLTELRQAGCRVAIDDFGTGYSSLAYLKALPLDYLKIDRKLAQDIAGSPRDRIVVRGVIEMALSLGLSVIAEGVETPEQLDLLAKEGCQYYQGFLCSEPLASAALAHLVAR